MNHTQWKAIQFNAQKFNPSAGFASAAKILSDIQSNTISRRNANSLANYRNESIDLARQKQEFDQNADARKEAEQAKRSKRILNSSKNSGYSLLTPLLNDPEIQKTLKNRGVVNTDNLIARVKENGKYKTVFSDPNVWSQAAYEDVILNGGSIEDAKIAKQSVLSKYNTADKDLVGKLLVTPTAIAGSLGSGKNSGGSSNKLISKSINESDINTLRTEFMSLNNIEGGSRLKIPFTNISPFDLGDYDLTRQDLLGLEAELRGELSPGGIYAVAQALITDPADGTTELDIRDRLSRLPKDKKDAMIAYGKKVEAIQERTLGGRNINTESRSRIFNDTLKNSKEYNRKLLQSTIPRAESVDTRKAIFEELLNTIIPDSKIQKSDEGDKILSKAPPQAGKNAPPVIDEPNITAVDKILNNMNSPETQGEALLNQNIGIGGSEQARMLEDQMAPIDNRIFNTDNIDLPNTPEEDFSNNVKELGGKIFSGVKNAANFLWESKDKYYKEKTNKAIEAVQRSLDTGNPLSGIGIEEYKSALASRTLTNEDKRVLIKLWANRKK